MKFEKISKIIIVVSLLLIANQVKANCMWSLNDKCKDIAATTNWGQASSETNCGSTIKPDGSTAKCCCADDNALGCCEKKDSSGNKTTNNLNGENCKKITYAVTTFYQDLDAYNNGCIKKGAATCTWGTVVTDGVTSAKSGGCGEGRIKTSDSYCLEKKPTDGINSHSVCCCNSKTNSDTPAKKPLFIMPELQITIPGLNMTASNSIVYNDNGDGTYYVAIPWLAEYILGLYNYGLSIIGILAAIMLMAGGVLWLISRGDISKISQSRDLISGSVIGILIMLCSYLILSEINPDLVNLKPIIMGTIAKIDSYSLPESDQGSAPVSAGSNHEVPWFFQCSPEGVSTMYDSDGKANCPPDAGQLKKYGAGKAPNVCTSGCGVVSSLMVLGKYGSTPSLGQWTKDVISNGGRTCGSGSNISGLIKAAGKYGFKGVILNQAQIAKALDDGHPVVISVRSKNDDKCKYTKGGHYIVLTGWNEKSLNIADVNDPANTNKKLNRQSISLNDFNGCSLNSAFYLYK